MQDYQPYNDPTANFQTVPFRYVLPVKKMFKKW